MSLQASLADGPAAMDAAYLHVPFCFHKCHYCDFYSIVADADRQAAFTSRLIDELSLRARVLRPRPATVFCGGGTPTLLAPELWDRLLRALAETGCMDGASEFTVEANPETVTPALLRQLVAGGVNRISLGAQSFDPHLLKVLERWHDPASVPRAVAAARAAGIVNINIDLIFGIPGQTLESLAADLAAALALAPTHLSCYGLTYEPHTAMTRRLELGQFKPIDEDLERDMYRCAMDTLGEAGFEQYEISNWARRPGPGEPSWRCRHNLAYWRNDNWLGYGPSAASHVNGWRWKNDSHLGRYLESRGEPPIVDIEHLDPGRQAGERLMLGLRLREGIARAQVERLLGPEDPRRARIGELVGQGMLEQTSGSLRLSEEGLFLADAVIAELL